MTQSVSDLSLITGLRTGTRTRTGVGFEPTATYDPEVGKSPKSGALINLYTTR